MNGQQPSTDRAVPERKHIKHVLRDAGLSNRQIDALLRDGWKSLVGESVAEAEELRDQLSALRERLGN